MSALLEIKNLKAGYSWDTPVLKDVDLSIESGEVLGVIGTNGSGKSTLAKTLVGRVPFRSGSITFDGVSLIDEPESRLSKMGISYMEQGGVVFGSLSVEENLKLAAGKQKIHSICTPSYYQEKRRMRADFLSGGERHMLALSMALASNPKLLILDEPCAGLSPNASETFYRLLKQLMTTRSLAILLIEHNVARAVALSSRIALVTEGRINLLPADMETIKHLYIL